ncbi:hypothetical protein [Nitrosopumilus adriaticus]
MITKSKDRPLTNGVQILQSQHYQNQNHSNSMKTAKEIYEFKKELIKTLETGDKQYYGLSLESLVKN